MGKPSSSSSSCLKIIACGSDSPVEDDVQTSEAKGSSDKRGWSFRKRSARHRVLSNNVTTESLSLADKEVSQSTSIQSQAAAHPSVTEKVVALEQSHEKQLPLSSVEVKVAKSTEPELSETLDADKPSKPVQPTVSETLYTAEPQETVEPEVSVNVSEPPELGGEKTYDTVIVSEAVPSELEISEGVVHPESPTTVELKLPETVIASQDGVLEEPMVLAQTELVKLKSIVKLQSAIRGHFVRRQAVDTLYCMQGIVKVQSLVKSRHSKPSGDVILRSQTSMENLLKNAFAVQLLKSTPKSKSSITKCDPLKPSSSRLWLERWMDLYCYGLANLEKQEITSKDEQSQTEVESESLSKVESDSINQEIAFKKASKTLENGKNSIYPDPVQDCQTSKLLSTEEKMEQPCDNNDASFDFDGSLGLDEQKKQSILVSSLSNDLPAETEEPEFSTKNMAAKHVEVESKKSTYGSKKSSNPAFVAAQSKFEELSSTPNYTGSLGSTYQVSGTENHLDTASSRESIIKEKEEPNSTYSRLPYDMIVNTGGSENGTELSVTSALDSPYLSEAEAVEVDLEVKFVEEKSSNLIRNESLEVETKELEAAASDKHDNSEYVGLEMTAAESLQREQKSERNASDVQVDAELAHNSSSVASPNNSHRTPSSQVSGKVKKTKADKRTQAKHHDDSGVKSSGKKTPTKPLDESGAKSSSKRTPNKPHDDSGAKSSGKKTPNKPLDDSGAKSERRRNSFGSGKSENADQEPRDSISSTKAVPSYMQATKSAKAKANSPRSSPDVQDTDAYIIKKRHSLPGAGGRQGSPRVQRPPSQPPQSQPVKGNATTPPQERKWIK